MKLTILLLLLSSIISAQSTCSDATQVTSLPFQDTFCTPQNIQTIQSNPAGMLHPQYGCWSCIVNAQWYELTTDEYGGLLTMSLQFDLTNPFSPSTNHVAGYYAIFNACPEYSGTVISYPCNCNNSSGECWDTFGNNNSFIESSCFWSAPYGWPYNLYCQSSEPNWNFPSDEYQITFNTEPSTTYHIAVFPSASCWLATAYGCVDVEFFGPIMLSLPEPCIVVNDQGIQLIGEGELYRSHDLVEWVEVSNPDFPPAGIWYYKACSRMWAFVIPERRKFMEFDTLGRRVK